MTDENPSQSFQVAFVAGVTPDKWVRRWQDRHRGPRLEVFLVDDADQVAVLRDGRARMSFVRLPVDREGLHLIPLWTETQGVVLGKDHPLADFDTLESGDLTDEIVMADLPAKVAVETVAAGTGIVFLPMSVARVHQRKDVRAVPVTDLAETQIGLAWRVDDDDPSVEEFVGIVRGRTERSSRGSAPTPPQPKKKQRATPVTARPRRRTKRG